MEQLSSQEGEFSIPLSSSSYGGGGGNVGAGHGHTHQAINHHPHPHHHPSHSQNNNIIIVPPSSSSPSSPPPPDTTTHHLPPPPPPPPPSNGLPVTISSTPPPENNADDDSHHHQNSKKVIKYKECLKNHAAIMGGNATDGCGEFMPSGEEGTIEALTCSACNCHRNFHRKELEGGVGVGDIAAAACYPHHGMLMNPRTTATIGAKIFMGHPQNALAAGYHHQLITSSSRAAVNAQPRQMIMPYAAAGGSLASDQSDHDLDDGNNNNGGGILMMRPSHHHHQMVKKRHRTKFSQEQKEKMLEFAEKVGWKIQKQEEAVVQHFCQEVGVKRRVLKVWMHNNKHNLAKKNNVNPHQDDPQSHV